MRGHQLGVGLLAYLAVLAQVGILGAWPPFGAESHLIALGSAVWIVHNRPDLGVVWIVIGAGLIDWLLPVRFGTTLVPLLLAYAGLSLIVQRFVTAPSWPGTVVLGLILVLCTELPLIIISHEYRRLLPDLGLALLLLLPLSRLVTQPLRLRRLGLAVR